MPYAKKHRRERSREYARRTYQRDRERRLAACKRWASKPENREKRRLAQVRWRAENPERAKANFRRWRLANPDKVKESKKHSVQRNIEKERVRRADYHLRRRYGLSATEKKRMFIAQGSCCASCGVEKSKYWCVDHDHATNGVRSVLCLRCNTALGIVEDIELMEMLRRYLDQANHDATQLTEFPG